MTLPLPTISVVIPAWRGDHCALAGLLGDWRGPASVDLIVVTPRDEAGRYRHLADEHPAVRWTAASRGRASQMNAGAALARGDWIVFLHADTRLPSGWETVIGEADRDPQTVGGSFRFGLDSPDWRARLLERGVAARVRLLNLPYGDQALFVRRSVFEALGGYRDLPLMEDVDLVRRLNRAGRLHHGQLPVSTSARRWERDGWIRRSLLNPWLSILYRCGVSPRRLARRYFGRRLTAVAMMARAPWLPGKSRLAGRLT